MWVHAPADHRSAPYTTPLAAAPVQVARRPARRAWPGNRAVTALAGTFAMPTHPIHGALRRGLLVLAPSEETVRIRVAGRLRRVRVRMGFAPEATGAAPAPMDIAPAPMGFAPGAAPEPMAPAPAPEVALEAPAPRIVQPAGAGLLKAHLDLVDLAYRSPDPAAGVPYDLGEALARLGFVRLAGGGYHPSTVREHLRRLEALAARHIAIEGQPDEPIWRFYVREAGGVQRPLATERDWAAARRKGRVVAVPGAWLAACELPNYRLPVGRELLALPMDGHGHQVERLALLLASELAVWERAEMRHGPHAVKRGVGALLARAGVAELVDLRAEATSKGNGPKRLRSYLAGEGFADEGALAVLRRHAGLDVDIADEAAFWAAGRGWVERFWDARLRVGVRGFEAAALAAQGEPTARGEKPAHGEEADPPLAASPTPTGEWPITHWLPRAPQARPARGASA